MLPQRPCAEVFTSSPSWLWVAAARFFPNLDDAKPQCSASRNIPASTAGSVRSSSLSISSSANVRLCGWLQNSPLGTLEVGEHEDVEQFGAGSGAESVEPIAQDSLDPLQVHEGGR
jgi:hypothetical protein